MNPETPLEEALFLAAIQLPAGSRPAHLDVACSGDPALRARLEALLAAHEQATGALATGAGRTLATIAFDPADLPPAPEEFGPEIGRYKLLEKLGEGGCGVVYVAEQTEPVRRRVALKVIKLGMDTKAVVARFEAERQALALMDHPNIAKVLDAGTTDQGRPYFVMELVRGIRITDYCDQNQLPTPERLNLFIKVCQAIQHAHQKGIIHRDIKPSNILVTLHDGVPVPKVIDFGIAKATEGRLTEHTVYTQLHQFIGTPAYMSPEQAEMSGLDIDTRSDIYSLGVLLYELLTGLTPFDSRDLMSQGIDAMRRTLREREPARPSTRFATLAGVELTTTAQRRSTDSARLLRQVQGDLDWIVMKCLEKDRARRYETANGLAADLNRHLHNEPVTARPPSTIYRFQKAWSRNRLAFTAGAVVALTLVAGLATSLWQATRAREAERSERQQSTVAREERDRATQAEAEARAQAQANRRLAYAAEINVASQSLEGNALERARELLDRQRPKGNEEDLRGFEWRHLWQRCQGEELATFDDSPAEAVAYSPDGQFLAHGRTNLVVRDARTRRKITTLSARAATLSFSPTAPLLVSADGPRVQVWGTDRWQLLRTLPGAHDPAWFSPDGRWLLTAVQGGCRIWDTQTWKPLGDVPGAPPLRFASRKAHFFSPDSQFFATVAGDLWPGGDYLCWWRLPTLDRLPDLRPPSAQPGAGAFTRDGKHVITGLWNGEVQLWEWPVGRMVASRRMHTGWVRDIQVARDGRTFATASADRTLVIWDPSTFEPLARRRGHLGEITSIAFSPDGREIASASYDGTVKVWDGTAGEASPVLAGPCTVAGFTGDGRWLVAFKTNSLCLCSPETGERKEFPIPARGVPIQEGNWGRPARVKPDEPLVVCGRTNGMVEVWSLTDGALVDQWQAGRQGIKSVNFTGDGRRLVTGAGDGEVKVWDFATRRELLKFEPVGNHYHTAVTPGGRFVASASDSQGLWLHDLETRVARRLDPPGDDSILAVAISPDGQLLASTTMSVARIHLWELPSAREVAVLRGHVQGMNSIAISPDGRTLASGSTDRTVKLWSLSTRQELLTIPVLHPIPVLDFSPDGRFLAISDLSAVGRGVEILRAPSFGEIAQAGRVTKALPPSPLSPKP